MKARNGLRWFDKGELLAWLEDLPGYQRVVLRRLACSARDVRVRVAEMRGTHVAMCEVDGWVVLWDGERQEGVRGRGVGGLDCPVPWLPARPAVEAKAKPKRRLVGKNAGKGKA